MTEQLVHTQEPELPLEERPDGYYVPGTWTPAGYTLHKPPPEVAGRPLTKGYDLCEKFEFVEKDRKTTYTVPARGTLNTDLASIPAFTSWLVPKDGRHTQAALLHDAMIVNRAKLEEPNFESSPNGVKVDDVEADAILRRGMKVSGVPVVRRWMIWSAVALRTCFLFGTWRQKVVLVVSGLVFGVFGLFALPDLLEYPQYGSLLTILRLVGVGAALLAGAIAWRRWRRPLVAVLACVATAGLLWVAVDQLPDGIPAHVPSLLLSLDPPKTASLARPGQDSKDSERAAKEAEARSQIFDWYRYNSEDPFPLQAVAFLGVLAAGSCLTALLLWPRPLLGLSFPLLLGLLAFPLFFVLVATGVYWVAESPLVGLRWWKERGKSAAAQPVLRE